jgi:predicted sugar kinase
MHNRRISKHWSSVIILISKAKKGYEGVEDEHPQFGLHVELQRRDRVCSFLLLVLIVIIVDADLPRCQCAGKRYVGSFLSMRNRHVFTGRVCRGGARRLIEG